jgi:cytochrome c553
MRTPILFWILLAAVPLAQAQPAAGNAREQAAACAGCHGAQGEGNPASGFPRLAAQPQSYLARQLVAYADGSRKNQVMSPIAQGLSRQQIDALAAYYASLAAPAAKAAAPTPQAAKRGEQLATVGDNKLGVQGCANCHGPGGAGEPPSYPYLGGQHAAYLTAALAEWKSGARNTDPSLQMNIIAKRLSDSDMAALAAYYAGLPPPAPAAQRGNVAAGSAQRSAAGGASSGTSGTPTQGVGAEQGQATSGGGQGPGGGGGASGSGASGSGPGK